MTQRIAKNGGVQGIHSPRPTANVSDRIQKKRILGKRPRQHPPRRRKLVILERDDLMSTSDRHGAITRRVKDPTSKKGLEAANQIRTRPKTAGRRITNSIKRKVQIPFAGSLGK
jgi:hypothetical protein